MRDIEELETERAAVRLGHGAFTRRKLDERTIAQAARAFRHFRRRMERHHVEMYRAVATSAVREARNRHVLIERIRRKSGIEIEVISGGEEARLVRNAVLATLGDALRPRLILDLGGGSLELNFMRDGALARQLNFPLGTVRLMETYRAEGAIHEEDAHRLKHHILTVLASQMDSPPDLSSAVAVACGGNAEALAQVAPGPRVRGVQSINLKLLRDRMWEILRMDVGERMRALGVRRDRAEVIAIAALILTTLGRRLHLRSLLVPGVGVREGVLLDLVEAQYTPALAPLEERREARERLEGARKFAEKLKYDAGHAEQVRRLALSLFDQLRPLHQLGAELRLILELGAILHDAGHFVSRKSHHRHGEYLVRNAEIAGLRGWRRDMVACLVRYHNSKSEPHLDHKLYASLDGLRRHQVRVLTSLLRIAEKLETDHRQSVLDVDVLIEGRAATFRISARPGTTLRLESVARKASLFEREFHLRVIFRRAQLREQVA